MKNRDQFFKELVEGLTEDFVSVGIAKVGDDQVLSVFHKNGSADRFLHRAGVVASIPDVSEEALATARAEIDQAS